MLSLTPVQFCDCHLNSFTINFLRRCPYSYTCVHVVVSVRTTSFLHVSQTSYQSDHPASLFITILPTFFCIVAYIPIWGLRGGLLKLACDLSLKSELWLSPVFQQLTIMLVPGLMLAVPNALSWNPSSVNRTLAIGFPAEVQLYFPTVLQWKLKWL